MVYFVALCVVCCAILISVFSFLSVCVDVCEDRRKPTKKSPQKTRNWALRIFFPLFTLFRIPFFSHSLRNSFLFFCCHVILTISVTQILTTMFYTRMIYVWLCEWKESNFYREQRRVSLLQCGFVCICMNIEHASTSIQKHEIRRRITIEVKDNWNVSHESFKMWSARKSRQRKREKKRYLFNDGL